MAREIFARFKCPKCGENLSMKVDLDSLDFQGGIASITVLHGEPQHTVVVYLDINGEVRGVEVPELTLVVDEGKNEKVDLSDVVRINPKEILGAIGENILPYVILYVIADRPVYFVLPEIDSKIENVLEALSKYLNNGLKVEKNKLLEGRGFSILDSKFYLINEKNLQNSCIVYLATGKVRCVEPKSKFFKNFVKKFFKSDGNTHEAMILIKYYDNIIKTAYSTLRERGGAMNYKQLFKLINVHSKDAEIVLDAMRAMGLTIEKNVVKIR